jgi:hypothetical protein
MRNATTLTGVIWVGDVGFVCEERYHDVDLPGARSVQRENVDQVLLAGGVLPDLRGAPAASWLLARVARLAGKRFPYSYGEVVGSDGADYWLRFYCVDCSGKPLGTLSCFGKTAGIVMVAQSLSAADPDVLLDSFIRALLAAPKEVSKCRIIVQYSEMTDPEIAFHIPRVYGWDGRRYLNEGAPEHAVDPSEYQ